MKKLTMILVMLGVCCVLSPVRADLTDDFSVAHDYLASGVAGTIWDGVYNPGGATTLAAGSGVLTVAVPNGIQTGWGVWNAPLLYINATGDFEASVEVANYVSGQLGQNWWKASLVVRAADPNYNGNAGEDQLLLQLTNPTDGGGAYDRQEGKNWNNGAETGAGEAGGEGTYWVPFRGMKVVRTGNSFQYYVRDKIDDAGDDPNLWTDYGRGPMLRPDLAGAVLQVGIVFEGGSGGPASSDFDNFTFIPEPATMSLLGIGLVALIRRRK